MYAAGRGAGYCVVEWKLWQSIENGPSLQWIFWDKHFFVIACIDLDVHFILFY